MNVQRRQLLQYALTGVAVAFLSACRDGASGGAGERFPDIRLPFLDGRAAPFAAPANVPLVVNFWASWCEPCREEMPELVRFYKQNKKRGLRLVLVSADVEDGQVRAAKFLQEQGIDIPSFRKIGDDMEFINGFDPKWDGGLPSSFFFDGDGRLQRLWSGPVTRADLQAKFDAIAREKNKPSKPERKTP